MENKLVFQFKDFESQRTVSGDELLGLITNLGGVTRKALLLLTGNKLTKRLATLERHKAVIVRPTWTSGSKPAKTYFVSRKALIKDFAPQERLAMSVYYLRSRGWLLGSLTANNQGDIFTTAIASKNTAVSLQFISLSSSNQRSALSDKRILAGYKPVYVCESIDVYKRLQSAIPANAKTGGYMAIFVNNLDAVYQVSGMVVRDNNAKAIVDEAAISLLNPVQVDELTVRKAIEPYKTYISAKEIGIKGQIARENSDKQ